MELEFAKTAHELKNMLSLIQGTFQLIENKHPEARDYEYWGQIRDDITQMNTFIEEAGRFNRAGVIEKKRNDLTKLLYELVRNYSPICQTRRINLCMVMGETSREQAEDCNFDYDKLSIVFSNLLKNAIEACEQDATIDICLNYIEDKWTSWLEVSVINDGAFENVDGRDIFEPFVTSKSDGTGLGLPIVKEIVLAHGGEVEVSSDGQRTCFAVRIPHAI